MFQGPHAYISPSLYDTREAVPTWNYIVAHAYGATRILDGAGAQRVLEESFAVFEPAYRAQWDGLDEEFRNGLSAGVVALEVVVTRLDGKYKISGNRTPAERARIASRLAAPEDTHVSSIGRAMLARAE